MKRFLFLAVLLVLLVSPVYGLALTFQNSGDFAEYVTCSGGGTGSCTWTDNSAACTNSFVVVSNDLGTNYLVNIDPIPSTYTAFSLLSYANLAGFAFAEVKMYDSAGVAMGTFTLGYTPTIGRYELKSVGGTATLYVNGVALPGPISVTQNPSYVSVGLRNVAALSHTATITVDDFVMGDTESGQIFGVPAEGCYIRKDPIGGGSGLYNASGALVNTYNMSVTWAKKSDGNSINVVLQNWGTGVNADSFATGTSTISGTKSYPIADEITNTYNYGYYVVKTNPAIVGVYSRTIPYQMGGAIALWDKEYYSQNDIAGITSTVSTGYWDTGTYAYSLKITDLYGNEKQSTTITAATESTTVQFTTEDDLGVYVAWLYATKISDGTQYLMSQDLTTLMGYVRVEGYAMNSTSETPLSSVNISITQGAYSQNQFTSAAGYYNTSAGIPFGTGEQMTINVTKAGYRQRIITFTPQVAKTINLTIPLEPLSVVHTGIMLRGLALDNVYTNPIASPVVIARNGTANYSVTANTMGEYIFDDTRGGVLSSGACYQLLGVKTGYSYVSPLTPTCVYGV